MLWKIGSVFQHVSGSQMAFRDHVTPLRLSTALPAEVSISPAQNEPLYSPVQWEERCLRHLCSDWVKNTWQRDLRREALLWLTVYLLIGKA